MLRERPGARKGKSSARCWKRASGARKGCQVLESMHVPGMGEFARYQVLKEDARYEERELGSGRGCGC